MRIAGDIILCIVFVAGGASGGSNPLGASQTRPTPIEPPKIQLNQDEMGTADDLSLLRQTLAENFKLRNEQHVYKRGFERRADLREDERIEKTVLVKAERSIKLREVTKVLETVEAAGAAPVLLPITVSERKAKNIKPSAVRVCIACALAKDRRADGEYYPNALTLLVRLRESTSKPPLDASGMSSIDDFMIADGIPIALSRTGEGSIAMITISKDGDLALDEKPIERLSLEKEIRERLNAKPASERVVFVKVSPDNTYGSLEDIYYAAFAAGAKRIALDSSAAGQEQPAVAKDSVQVTAFTFNVYRGNYDVWSWVPRMEFRVNGPIESGSQLYVEFNIPGAGPWVKFDCRTEATQKGYWWKTQCGGREIPEEKGSTYTGPVSFAIKIRNELTSTDATLFTGRAKVEKVLSNLSGPKAANNFVYFVNHDWNLPIGYIFLTPDDVYGWKKTTLNVSFWTRGDYHGNFQPHLFYQGKEVGKISFEGREVGTPTCDPEVENNTTQTVADTVPQKATWVRVRCRFFNVQAWDRTGEEPGMFGPLYQLEKNPGEYEFKVLWNNRLARSIKFTVASDGKFDNGIAAANKLGSDRVIVPVQIIGDQDGAWDRTAWKTESFYGNPLTGFTVSP